MRLSQASQENPWTVPGVNGAATVPTHIRVSDIAEQIRQQNVTIQQEFDRLQSQLVQNHNSVLDRLDSLPIIGASSAASQTVVASIARVKFAQDAAVLAYLVAHWIDPTDSSIKMKELGPYKAVGTRQEFNLVDEGLPDGATVRFSSYVVGVGEYENDLWFKIDGSESHGAIFRQTGTAFKGWFQYTGIYRPFIAHDDFQVGAISHVKYVQNAAVSAYLLVRWIDPSDGITRSKDLGPWKAIATREEFILADEEIPEGSSVQFASYVAGVGEYTSDIVFKVDNSASQGAMFTQTGTAFQGFFTFEGLSLTSSVEDTKN
ncbi:hypothetical protein C8F04DRAFT_1103126 [Mycena alexandri]|uniref:Uncharacterized protein n=1 Tax=Mycena alexandri TaxID=1745969 RepID=A0AAD6SU43_9AGAR|nr:hypothetical protein C8F04DRAFT_1103126 [Mycena alexandri]